MILGSFSAFRNRFAPLPIVDIHGYEHWEPALMRAGGFDTFTTMNVPFEHPTLPIITVTVDAGPDTVPWTDEYDWYLSQRTDAAAQQYWAAQHLIIWPGTYSGVLVMWLTALALTKFPEYRTDEAQQVELFRHTFLYMRRIADGAIQVLDWTRYFFSEA